MFNDKIEIIIEDDSDNDPSWEKSKEDKQLLQEDEEHLELHCEQCNYETMSKADLSHHVKMKHISFKNVFKE